MQGYAVVRRRPWRREAVAARPCGEEARGEPQHRTEVNPWASRTGRVSVSTNAMPKIQPRPGREWGRARRDIRCSYPGRSAWVRASGRPEEGNDDGTTPMQKSDLFARAMTPVKAGRAKGEMG